MSFRDAVLAFEMGEPTGVGSSYRLFRRVRLGDVTPNGRLRVDATARYLQDIANDDSRDAQWSDPHWWVVRRTVLDIVRFPTYLDQISLVTWCGGLGSHWAERRTRIMSLEGETLIDAASLWVHVDKDTLQPSRVPDDVAPVLGESAGGRKVGARLLCKTSDWDSSREVVSTWPLRFTDFDTVGHMNNAAYWEILEEQMLADRTLRAPMRAAVEHLVQVDPGATIARHVDAHDGDVSVLVRAGNTVHSAMWAGRIN